MDYGELNKEHINHSGSIPNIEWTLENVASCRYKTKIDKRKGFWQLESTPYSQALLAFITPQRTLFKCRIMPPGVANAPDAPALLQQVMHKILSILRRGLVVPELISPGAQMKPDSDDVCPGMNAQEVT